MLYVYVVPFHIGGEDEDVEEEVKTIKNKHRKNTFNVDHECSHNGENHSYHMW